MLDQRTLVLLYSAFSPLQVRFDAPGVFAVYAADGTNLFIWHLSPAERAHAHKLESLIFIARDIIAFKGYTLAPWEMPAEADFELTTTGWRFDRRSPKRVTYSVGRRRIGWGYNNPASDPLLKTARALAADSRNLIIAVREEIATARWVAALTLKGIADSRESLRRADLQSHKM